MLVAGFAAAVWLDPWSLSEHDPAVLVGSPRMAARHAQAVVIAMAFLQLMVGRVLLTAGFPARASGLASGLSGAGALVYAAGYGLQIQWEEGAWLVVVGALLNFVAFAVLAGAGAGRPALRVVLLVFCFGMLLDTVMGLFAADPERFLPSYLGAEDGVRMRMLRLARAAVVALSLLTLLYQDLAARAGPGRRLVYWGQVALLVGAAGMPLVLGVAAFTTVEAKYLLPIPAQATFLGTLAGAWLAAAWARPLELWGWLLVAVSMGAGLLMGLYAFDGPLPAPAAIGAYNDYARRLTRLAHAYCIVLGLLSIFLARELEQAAQPGWARRLGVPLLVAGSVGTVAGVLLLACLELPPTVLRYGPAAVTGGLLLSLASLQRARLGASKGREMGTGSGPELSRNSANL
jgi:hypothetical protein